MRVQSDQMLLQGSIIAELLALLVRIHVTEFLFMVFLIRFFISTVGFWLVQKCVVVLELPLDAKQIPLKSTKTSKYCINKTKRRLKTLHSVMKVQTVSFDEKLVVYC